MDIIVSFSLPRRTNFVCGFVKSSPMNSVNHQASTVDGDVPEVDSRRTAFTQIWSSNPRPSSVGILNLCSSSSLSMVMAATARTVEEIFKDYTARRAGLVRALTDDSDEFYAQCDPEKENLCLYGHPNERWEVTLPADEVPPELPEPVLGINFARDGMTRKDWLSLIAVHGDSWLLSVAFYLGARLNRNDRKRLFSMINDLPTVFEVVTDRKPREKPSIDSGSKSRGSTKRSSDGQVRSNPKHENYHVDEDEHMDTLCGSCGGNYNADEFWIGCDICERWFHGKRNTAECKANQPSFLEEDKDERWGQLIMSCTIRMAG
ncbi:unnamed protein product [Linum tenue]|uniref:PHD finger protein ALFIN-LIKE n=1 Tax=Linum tenue TaxID=586396 RepID=A0AAV0Q3G6_9ROSI|nr:unnamed protein product [Linum tenue]